ncbi:MAG: hypothetical protein OXN44_04245 [Acidimicrobiaceae bacterium]|nr:hypothetical protein [Acidimicrobiaceae bacterium]
MAANSLIPRTCTEIASGDSTGTEGSQPLRVFRDVPAYVLLGEPGSGKTTEFKQERMDLGDAAELIQARRFAKADIAAHPEWRSKVLFIDGLDETRAGGGSGTTVLDEIQSRLDSLGKPSFRISCRAADWLGPVDRGPLADVSPDGRVTTLNLDPLDRTAVHEYLKSELDAEDPTAFISETVAGGLEFMLDNPLLFKLLIASRSESDGIPSSRQKVFERACRMLATEHNESHPSSARAHSPETVLDAAKRLCAIQLLANKSGYTRSSAHAEVGFVPLAEVSSDVNGVSAFAGALSTNLFTGVAEQHIVPVHRQIAEYLGAMHLTDLIDRGDVSVGRTCGALLSPIDSRVVTDLRGLAAWLATLSPPSRNLLIAADPVGMALYGDISEWPVADRRRLLDCLVAQARPEDLLSYTWFDTTKHRYRDAAAWNFRSLCKPDMADSVTDLLGKSPYGEHSSHILELVLRCLSEADDDWLEELSCLRPQVECLTFDESHTQQVRLAAIAAFNRIAPPGEPTGQVLLEVLESAGGPDAKDPDIELTGILLRLLYPRVVSPGNMWRYYFEWCGTQCDFHYWQFWNDVLLEGSDVERLCQLLNGFTRGSKQYSRGSGPAPVDRVPLAMLVRVLEESDRVVPEDVYGWMLAILNRRPYWNGVSKDERSAIVTRLHDEPDVHKSLMRLWLKDSIGHPELGRIAATVLFSSLPDDFVGWCADEARSSREVDLKLAKAFVELPIRFSSALKQPLEETIEQLRSELSPEYLLVRHLDEYLTPSPGQREHARQESEHEREIDEIRAEHERQRRQRQDDWKALLLDSEEELAANRFPAPNLHTLAQAYFGILVLQSDLRTPRDRVAELIGDNAELLDTAMAALRNAPLRDDVPPEERTVELSAESKHDWLAYPVLAGLAIREAEDSIDEAPLPDESKAKALAIYSAVALMPSQYPEWPKQWLKADPERMLKVLQRCSTAAIKRGDTHLSMLNWLDEVAGLEDELHDFRSGLLRSISVRLPVAQLPIVDDLIQRLARHPNAVALKDLLSAKLHAKSMTDAQRVRWMALDAIMNGGDALGRLDEFIGLNAKRARQLAEFFPRGFDSASKFVDRLPGADRCTTFRVLASIIARNFPPHEWKSGAVVRMGRAENMSDLVNRWINDLGGQPTEEAGAALDALIADKRLSSWHRQLEFARNRQQRLHSDTSYSPMDTADVIALLHNGPPANVADLLVLLRDHLSDLGAAVRGDNSDPWRQFWADDQGSPPEQPKHEDSCRDALLAMLRIRLPEGVDAQPEGQYAADRRADIRVSSRDFNIPIEIKKNSHPDLWSAIDGQLIASYTSDPATGGFGVYAVLWFGSGISGYPRHPTAYDRPETPDELEQRLIASLSHEQRRKIGVLVLDVTKP